MRTPFTPGTSERTSERRGFLGVLLSTSILSTYLTGEAEPIEIQFENHVLD